MSPILTINGMPSNGYTMNDTRYPQGTFPQQSLWQGNFKGQPVSALVDTATIWQAGTENYGIKNTIKIEFDPNESGAWSYVGLLSSRKNPSMTYGFLDPPLTDFTWNGKVYPLSEFKYLHRNGCNGPNYCDSNFKPGAVVLHEFMHALGGSHEHQNAQNSPLHLNTEGVYESYCGVPDPPEMAKCRQTADFNVLSQYTCFNPETEHSDTECYSYTDFDPDSILLYPMYDQWIAEGYSNPTKNNFRLSASDIAWLQDYYPINATEMPIIEVTFNNGKEWEHAWVQKIVTEYLAPYVGVNFVWPGMPLKNPPVQRVGSPEISLEPTQPPIDGSPPSSEEEVTSAPTKAPIQPSTGDKLNLDSQDQSVIIGVSIAVGVLVIGGLIWYSIPKSKKK